MGRGAFGAHSSVANEKIREKGQDPTGPAEANTEGLKTGEPYLPRHGPRRRDNRRKAYSLETVREENNRISFVSEEMKFPPGDEGFCQT